MYSTLTFESNMGGLNLCNYVTILGVIDESFPKAEHVYIHIFWTLYDNTLYMSNLPCVKPMIDTCALYIDKSQYNMYNNYSFY